MKAHRAAKYSTEPIQAMKTVDKPGGQMNPMVMAGMAAAHGVPLAAIIEVATQPGCVLRFDARSSCRKIVDVSGHNYLFTSKCCMNCIKVKHKKMLRAYLIDHGAVPGLRLWWKVWRATR